MKRILPTTFVTLSAVEVPYFILLTLFLSLSTYAQSFQWAKRGGSTNTLQVSEDYNNVIDMVTDEADNVYLLCRVGASSLQVDGSPLQAYSAIGTGASRDILLTSFTKNGKYRWSKVIGRGGNDYDSDLKVQMGHVYLSGNTRPTGDSSFFDTDTVYHQTYNGYQAKQAFLVKYDTAGVFQWLQMPGAEDIIPIGGTSEYGYWFDVAPNGDIYWLCDLVSGCLANTSQPITQKGTYVLRYDQNGQFLGRVQLEVDHYGQFLFNGSYNEGNFIRNHQTGQYYLGGTKSYSDTFLIGGDTIKNRMYLAVFDSIGQLKWKKESHDSIGYTNFNHFKLDNVGNIFLTGSTKRGQVLINNISFNSTETAQGPFVIKLDAKGNTMWSKFGVVNANTFTYKIAPNNNGEVAITGQAYNLYFQGPNDLDTLKAAPNQGYDAFIARFDTQTGDLLGMESAKTPFGAASYGYSITADSEGSYYLGGNFDQQLYMGPDILYKIGSQRSFFVAKYACGIPTASFTVSNDTVGYYFTYTGTPADSVIWDFGDGSAPYKGDSVSHVYSAKGQYIVCATAYDGCGDTTRCDTVDVTTIALNEFEVEEASLFQLAPNPANTEVSIIYELPQWTANSTGSLEVHDLRGARIAEFMLTNGKGTHVLNTIAYKPSVYLIILRVNGEVMDYSRLVIQR